MFCNMYYDLPEDFADMYVYMLYNIPIYLHISANSRTFVFRNKGHKL